jgi:6,7-dimethyl-8-ribityllumazine synthase
MLDFNIPVIFGVLTTDNEHQALERVGGKEGHKGKDAVDAAISMAEMVENLTSTSSVNIGYY